MSELRKLVSESGHDVCSDVMYALTLKKRTKRWLLLIAACLLFFLFSDNGESSSSDFGRKHIAQVNITGPVEGLTDPWYQQLEKLYKNRSAAALILVVDSPGGAVSIADAGYTLLKRIHKRIPIITVIESTAASAGYMMASTGDVVISQETSIVGSIGVLLQIPVFKSLLENIGIEYSNSGVGDNMDVIPFKGLTEFTNKYLDLAGEDSYEWFRSIVQFERRLSNEQLKKVIGGKIFLGHEALSLGLIDGFGDISTARQWLKSHDSGLDENIPLVNYSRV